MMHYFQKVFIETHKKDINSNEAKEVFEPRIQDVQRDYFNIFAKKIYEKIIN